MTNCPVKRDFSLISSDPDLKYSDDFGKNIDSGDDDLHFVEHKGIGVENVANKKCDEENDMSLLKGKEACGLSHPYTGIISSQESITSAMMHTPGEFQEKHSMLEDNHILASDNVATQSILELDDASRDSSQSTISLPACSEFYNSVGNSQDEDKVPLEAIQRNFVGEGLATCISRSSCENLDVGKLESSNRGSVDWLKLPTSLGPKAFSLERCTWDSVERNTNLNGGDSVVKACTCSFCLKAAYIWADIHYQDIKGRIAALKKSQKEVGVLVRNSSGGTDVCVHGEGNSNTSSKLESDLTGQWKSLFLHMEGVLARESNQLQAGFSKLKELRDKSKIDLEAINATPSDNQ